MVIKCYTYPSNNLDIEEDLSLLFGLPLRNCRDDRDPET